MLWTLSVKLFISVSLVVFSVFIFLFFSFETNSSLFSFCLTLSVSMVLGETVTCSSLEGVSLCWSLLVSSDFGGRAGSQVNMGHFFPQGVLIHILFWGSGVEDRGANARARCEQWFFYAQWLSPHYQEWGWVSSCWRRSPEDWAQTGSIMPKFSLLKAPSP